MKSGIPWSVKGIEPEVREAAKDAARRSGLTLGEWLNTAIMEQTEARADSKGREMHPLVKDRFSRIAEELAMMTAERPPDRAGRPYQPPPEPDAKLESIIERVDNQERYLTEALTSVNERLKAINAQVARQAEQAAEGTGAAESYASLEAAVRNIVGHLDVSQRRTQETITTLQDQVRRLSDRDWEENSTARHEQVERQIATLSERLQRQEQGSKALNDVQAQVKELGEQLDALKSLPEALLERATQVTSSSFRSEIKVLEGTLHSLAANVETTISHLTGLNGDVEGLRNDVTALKEDMDSLGREVERGGSDGASRREIQLLQGSLEKLSARFEELPIIGTERRLSEMTRRISDMEIRGRALPQLSEVAQKIEELEGRLAGAQSPSAAEQAFDQMFEQMRVFDDRLAGAEEKLHSVANIERSISQIFQALEDSRTDVHEVAEAAAKRVVLELQQNRMPEETQQPVLAALEAALDGMRQQNQRTEQQTQETFDALHETLEEIINRLSEVESAQEAPRVSKSENKEPVAPPQLDRPQTVSDPAPEPIAAVPDWRSNVLEHLEKVQSELKAEPQLPFERGRETADPAEELFTREGETPQAKAAPEPVESVPAQEDDFIAAARRAAQAAAQGARHSLGRGTQSPATGERVSNKRMRLFPLSFFQRPARVKPRHPRGVNDDVATAADAAKVSSDGSRRRLLLAALLLLAAVSAYAVRTGYKAALGPEAAPQSKTQFETPAGITDSTGSSRQEGMFEVPTALAKEIDSPSIRLAALEGQADAQFVIAGRYMEGLSVSQNPVEAAKWYHKAAVQGLAPAQYRLATLYERGTGVEQSSETAIHWYEKAATQGNVKAMHNLGVLLAQRPSVDYATVARWFTAAATHGVKDSQYNVAILHERGLGVRKDPAEALFWYLAAAQQGDEAAANKAAALEIELAPAPAQAARERFETWQPEKLQPNANMVSLALAPG